MNVQIFNTLLLFCALLGFSWLTMSVAPTTATASQPALSPPAHQALSEAQKLLAEERWPEAEESLAAILDRFAAEPLAVATAHQFQGFVLYETGRVAPALAAFEAALAHEDLPLASRRQLLYNTAQMLLELERPEAAVARLEEWLALAGEDKAAIEPQQRVRAARVFLAAQRYRSAIDHLLAAIKEVEAPPESWYRLLIQAGQGAEDWPALRRWLSEIVSHYPGNKLYWQQLAAVHLQLGDEAAAAAALGSAYHNGLLTAAEEILYLVRLLLHTGVPRKAAAILQESLDAGLVAATADHYQLLADGWQLAREQEPAVAALQRALALNDDPAVALKLARLLSNREGWQEAIPYLQQATKSDDEKIGGEAWLLLGMAHHQLAEPAEALAAFQQARRFTGFGQQADNWLQYLSE